MGSDHPPSVDPEAAFDACRVEMVWSPHNWKGSVCGFLLGNTLSYMRRSHPNRLLRHAPFALLTIGGIMFDEYYVRNYCKVRRRYSLIDRTKFAVYNTDGHDAGEGLPTDSRLVIKEDGVLYEVICDSRQRLSQSFCVSTCFVRIQLFQDRQPLPELSNATT